MRMQERALALVVLSLGLGGCGYATFSSPQFDAVRGLFPREVGVDLESLAWTLRWAGEAQPVLPVIVKDQFVFTHRSGVQVTFDGWQVTRVAGLLGREVLTLRLDDGGGLSIESGARQLFEGPCSPWQRGPAGYEQRCEGLGRNEIALDEAGNISRLSFTIHPEYGALVLER